MISLFERNLKRMQQELTDLKTVHQRGLGTIRFFRQTFKISPTQAHKVYVIKGDIVTGEPERPFIQIIEQNSYTNPNGYVEEIDSGTSTITLKIYENRVEQTTIEIISTSETTNWRLDHVE